MPEVVAKDIFDKDIHKGDLITYPVRYSSSMWMSYGYVVEVNKSGLLVEGGSSEGKRTVSSLDRIVLVENRRKED